MKMNTGVENMGRENESWWKLLFCAYFSLVCESMRVCSQKHTELISDFCPSLHLLMLAFAEICAPWDGGGSHHCSLGSRMGIDEPWNRGCDMSNGLALKGRSWLAPAAAQLPEIRVILHLDNSEH